MLDRNGILLGLAIMLSLTSASQPALAQPSGNSPVGTWLLEIQFPAASGPPPFKELVTFNHRGTVSETNALLNANVNPFGPLKLTASDGFGSWEKVQDGTVVFSFLKMAFCADGFGPAEQAFGCQFPNQHIGYLQVRAVGEVNGGQFTGGVSVIELLIGTDPQTAWSVPLGSADSSGFRIAPEAP